MKRNLISLFAGAGGLDLGLEMAGFTTRIANELEAHACETLRKNQEIARMQPDELGAFIQDAATQRCYKGLSQQELIQQFSRLHSHARTPVLAEAQILGGDIRNIRSAEFASRLQGEELFCIAGGPPCQPFSKAGKQKSLDCTKNGDLFNEFVRLVRDLRPRWFIFENVKGLTFTKTEVLYYACRSCHTVSLAPFSIRQDFKSGDTTATTCEHCGGTDTVWKLVNESGGSLKIILNEFRKAGYACQTAVLNAADYGAAQIRERLFIVGNNAGKQIHWPEPTHGRSTTAPTASAQTDLFANDSTPDRRPWVSIHEALWSKGHPVYGKLDRSRAELWVKNVVRPHDEPVTWSLDRPAPTIGAHQGPKLAIAPRGVPEAQIYRQQWHTRGRRQGDTPPVYVEHQYLSDEELLILQTFPSWWYLHGTRMQRAFQIGNAVPPLLGKLIGTAILQAEDSA